MKLSAVAAVALLSGAAFATDCKAVTVTSTVTVTNTKPGAAGPSNSNKSSNEKKNENGALSTKYDTGSDGKQTVRACPTGKDNFDCYVAIYAKSGSVEKAHVVNVAVSKNNKGEVRTVTVTKTDRPTITPAPSAKAGEKAGEKLVTDVITETSTLKGGKKTTITRTKTHSNKLSGTGSATNSKPTHKVAVGRDNRMEFEPKFIDAKAGDVVRFTFYPKNHSVTTNNLEEPCLENRAFDSGHKFTFIKNSTTSVDYKVANESPVFFHR